MALENGLVLLSCGVYGNTIRILVPLTADDAIVDEGLAIIERSLTEIGTTKAAACRQRRGCGAREFTTANGFRRTGLPHSTVDPR